jgi:hypothetical protein
MTRTSWVSVSIGIAALVHASPTAAYCRTNTCEQDLQNPDCLIELETGCLTGGEWLYWNKSCIAFSVQAEASPLRHIDYESAVADIGAAMAVWGEADCGGQKVAMTPHLFPAVACTEAEYNTEGPNANTWVFRDEAWPYEDDGLTLALTSVWFNVKTGEIYDADVELNSYSATFSAEQGATLREVATHEAGHFYGLAHSADPHAIMYASYSMLMGISETLTEDDRRGICAAYPPGPEVPACDPTPRHGFSPHCGSISSGCSVALPGERRAGWSPWWAAVGLIVAIRGRRRTLLASE